MFGGKSKFVVIFLSLIALRSPFLMAEKPLKLVTLSFRPFIYQENGEVKGIDAEITKELFKRAGIKYKIEFLPWKRALDEVEKGTADAVMPAFKTPERESFAHFMTRPVHLSEYFIFVRKGETFKYEKIENLYNKKIGIDHGFSVSKEFDSARDEKKFKFKIDEAKSPKQNLKKLIAKRIDLYINNIHVVFDEARRIGVEKKVETLSPSLKSTPSYIAFSKAADIKDKKKVIEKLNKILNEMWEDGTIKKITSKYIN